MFVVASDGSISFFFKIDTMFLVTVTHTQNLSDTDNIDAIFPLLACDCVPNVHFSSTFE